MKNYIKNVIPKIYDFYSNYMEVNGYCPSYRTVKAETGICLDYISKSIHWLVSHEYLFKLNKGVYVINKEKPFKGVE